MEQELDSEKEPENEIAAAPGVDEPAEKPQPEFKIDIFRDWCKSCGICAAFCPRQCLGLDENGAPVIKDAKRCTGCRWCELHCPDFAICVTEIVAGEKKAGEGD
ncbi:MAG: 4Fe-4S ferredoxin [Deltaproteobacteria bacterium]|nr:4Fe-4S ferredoxin [Deltaproteobacteria bacterium]